MTRATHGALPVAVLTREPVVDLPAGVISIRSRNSVSEICQVISGVLSRIIYNFLNQAVPQPQ